MVLGESKLSQGLLIFRGPNYQTTLSQFSDSLTANKPLTYSNGHHYTVDPNRESERLTRYHSDPVQ